MASPLPIIVTLLIAVVSPSLATITVNTSAIIEKLTVDFYKTKCPNVEKIVADIMKSQSLLRPGYIPGIMRLHFHDCFVTGCDGSVLLLPARYNNFNPEMVHPANARSLRGTEVIDFIKAEVEKECPDTVSCADLLAYAAREAVVLAGNPYYTIPAGRRDGIIVDGNVAAGLPKGFMNITTLTEKYAEKGLTLENLVALEAAHSIGKSRCLNSICDPDNDPLKTATGADQIVDKKFKAALTQKFCPSPKDLIFRNLTMPLNPEKNDSSWGVSFYDNIMKGKSVIGSDLAMAVDPTTKDLVKKYANEPELWKNKFNEGMIRIGKINVLTGQQGEIRKKCGWINAVGMPPQ